MHAYHDHTDTELIALLAQENERAFEAIYGKYSASLYRYTASRIKSTEDAEEIIQTVFIRLWEKRHSLSHVKNLKAYLYSTCRNKIIDYIEHLGVRSRYETHYRIFTDTFENGTENLIHVEELKNTIEHSIQSLPENCQIAFRLSRFEQLSIADIATRMKLSTGTVENYITTALKHLREVLGKEYKIR